MISQDTIISSTAILQKKRAAVFSASLLCDRFITDLAAGAVDGTAAEPGPGGNRIVTDASGKLSISGGKAVFASGAFSLLKYATFARTPGRLLVIEATLDAVANDSFFGWGVDADGQPARCALQTLAGGNIRFFPNGTAANYYNVGTYTNSVSYKLWFLLRSTGSMAFIKGGIYTYPTLIAVSPLDNTANLSPQIGNESGSSLTSDFCRIPVIPWLPAPLASDGFSAWGTTDGLGHAETTGLGSGGGGKVWTAQAGTWGAAGGVVSASVLAGGLAIATVNMGTANIFGLCDWTLSAGVVGNVWRYIDGDNYLYSYHDGTNFVLKQRLATVETTIITGVCPGTNCMVILDGTAARLYCANTLVGTGTVDAAFANATKHGLYTTDTGNTLDNFVVYARGNEGQHAVLNRFAN